MKRKLWAIRELWSCFKGYSRLFFRAHLIWSVHSDEKTRDARLSDIQYQIDGTPLKYEQAKLERRWQRAAFALVYPELDQSLLSLQDACSKTPSMAAAKLYDKIEAAVIAKYFPKEPTKTTKPKGELKQHDH